MSREDVLLNHGGKLKFHIVSGLDNLTIVHISANKEDKIKTITHTY